MAKIQVITAEEFEARHRQHDLWIYFGVDRLKVRAVPQGNADEFIELTCGHAMRFNWRSDKVNIFWNDPVICPACDEMQTLKLAKWEVREGSRAWLDREKRKGRTKNERAKTTKKK